MPQFTITIQIESAVAGDVPAATAAALETAVATALASEGRKSGALTLRLTSDEEVAALNSTFRGQAGPTDVLTFAEEGAWPGPPPEEMPPYLGDIVIAVPTAGRQAVEGEHTLLAELQLLAVHGLLHLVGHEHDDELSREAMWRAQRDVLQAIGADLKAPGREHMADH